MSEEANMILMQLHTDAIFTCSTSASNETMDCGEEKETGILATDAFDTVANKNHSIRWK